MGTEAIDLHDWEVGTIGPWTDHYLPESNKFIMLGDYIDKYVPTADTIVEPGESFWMSPLYEFQTEKAIANPQEYDSWEMPGQRDADIVLHAYEAPSGPTDSISVNWQVMEVWKPIFPFLIRSLKKPACTLLCGMKHILTNREIGIPFWG